MALNCHSRVVTQLIVATDFSVIFVSSVAKQFF
jgi:hypothetical protein